MPSSCWRMSTLLTAVLVGDWTPTSDAHHAGCHRWHSCPSNRGACSLWEARLLLACPAGRREKLTD
jgi:hypothetical protein